VRKLPRESKMLTLHLQFTWTRPEVSPDRRPARGGGADAIEQSARFPRTHIQPAMRQRSGAVQGAFKEHSSALAALMHIKYAEKAPKAPRNYAETAPHQRRKLAVSRAELGCDTTEKPTSRPTLKSTARHPSHLHRRHRAASLLKVFSPRGVDRTARCFGARPAEQCPWRQRFFETKTLAPKRKAVSARSAQI
jgi:hypothetical protein